MNLYTVEWQSLYRGWRVRSRHWFLWFARRAMFRAAARPNALARWRVCENGQPLLSLQVDHYAGDLDRLLEETA